MSVSISDLRTEIEKNQLESLIPNPTILEKCKSPRSLRDLAFLPVLHVKLPAGVALCNRYPQTILEFLGRLEAFLMNSNVQSLTLDQVGAFEQSLHKDLNVSIFTSWLQCKF